MSIKVLKILLQNSLHGTHSKALQTPHYRCGKHSLELTKGTCKQLDMAQCLPRKKDETVATWYSTKTTFLRLSEVGGIVSDEASIGENRVARKRLFSTF